MLQTAQQHAGLQQEALEIAGTTDVSADPVAVREDLELDPTVVEQDEIRSIQFPKLPMLVAPVRDPPRTKRWKRFPCISGLPGQIPGEGFGFRVTHSLIQVRGDPVFLLEQFPLPAVQQVRPPQPRRSQAELAV